eukprot:s2427_g9.t1
MAAAASMPSSVAAQTVLLTATLKLGFLLFLLPETSETEEMEIHGGRAAVWGRIPEMLQEGVNILRRHQVLQRLALVLCLAGAGFTARNLFLRFYLASKLGADKADFAVLLPASLPGKIVTFALILPMLVHTCGELAALKVALPISGVVVCYAVLGGPALMFAPLMSAMKANLVGDEEQGKVQGIVAALRALANAAVGFLLGNGFHADSQPMGGVQAGLSLVVLLEFVASLVALTLPNSYIIGEFAIASSVVAGEEGSDTELVGAVHSQDDPADTGCPGNSSSDEEAAAPRSPRQVANTPQVGPMVAPRAGPAGHPLSPCVRDSTPAAGRPLNGHAVPAHPAHAAPTVARRGAVVPKGGVVVHLPAGLPVRPLQFLGHHDGKGQKMGMPLAPVLEQAQPSPRTALGPVKN